MICVFLLIKTTITKNVVHTLILKKFLLEVKQLFILLFTV